MAIANQQTEDEVFNTLKPNVEKFSVHSHNDHTEEQQPEEQKSESAPGPLQIQLS